MIYYNKSDLNGIGVYISYELKKGDVIGVSHVWHDGIWYMTTHGNYNHSENPNCIIRTEGNINLIIADKYIAKDEELTADYRKQSYLEQPEEKWSK